MGLLVEIDVGGAEGVSVIRCEGELDMATAAKLIDAFDRVGVEQPAQVRVDLRGVDFIDSTGLGCLVHGALIFQKQGARFEVLASEPVNAVIDRSWLKTLLAPPGA